jgi:hypothetical protein
MLTTFPEQDSCLLRHHSHLRGRSHWASRPKPTVRAFVAGTGILTGFDEVSETFKFEARTLSCFRAAPVAGESPGPSPKKKAVPTRKRNLDS